MLIDKEDAIKAICEACYMYKYIGEHYRDCKYYPCDDVTALEAVPEAPKPSGEFISRADAIEAVRMSEHRITIADEQGGVGTVKWDMWGVYTAEAVEAIKALPSAEQVTGKLKNPCDSLLTDDSESYKEQKSKLDLISRELAMERIANDNVVGGMERINEYNNSTEFNEYLDGISDAITTVFCDVPSADITETETCQKCQDVTDTILNRQGERIKELEESAEAVQGWIPVSDRLPENSGRYIVTLKDIWATTVKVAVYGVMPQDTHNKKVFWLYDSCFDDLDITEDVIAWMPLPKPYKGGDDE